MAARRVSTVRATRRRSPNLGRTKTRPRLGTGLRRRVKAGSMSVRKARRIQTNRVRIRRKARRRAM